jgi:hypothetical protein
MISDEELFRQLDIISEDEERTGVEMFMGRPDRWYETPRWRCGDNHVSKRYLKSSGLHGPRGAICLVCFRRVALTFPEDLDGSLLVRKFN